jgi:ABC-type cobalamin/Fe3+-siderophores transport system ATPase subunit
VREDRREVRVAARAGDLKHIFLIAGPSGSGKSTIMSEFVYDRLPKDISDSLPLEAKNWQRTSGNELSREGLARIRARVPARQASWSTTISCAPLPNASSTTPTIQPSKS